MRVVAYYRVSSTAQRERNTIAAQKAEVRALVAAKGWTLVDEQEDDGRSARSKLSKRTGLAATLKLVRAGKVDAVVFVAFDRLSRSERLAERGAILGEFQDADCKIVVSGGRLIDLGTFSGRVEANLLLELAAEESAEKSRRAIRGRVRAADNNRPPCPAPWGLACAHDTHRWHETPHADTVREAVRRVANGETCAAVARDFAARAVPLPRRGRWHAGTVARIVRSDVYSTGQWAANKGAIVNVPVLVDASLHAAARARLAGYQLQGLRHTRGVYLLEAHAVCGLCGSPIRIHGGVTNRRGKVYRYTYYACDRVRAGGRGCTMPRLQVERIDARVWAALSNWIATPDLVADALAKRGGEATEEGRAALRELGEWRAKLEAIPAREALTLERERRGLLTPAAVEAELGRLQRERRVLEQQVRTWEGAAAGAAAEAEDVAALETMLGELRARLPHATPEERRGLVQVLTPSGWTLHPDGRAETTATVCLRDTKGTPDVTRSQPRIPVTARLVAVG